MKVILGLVSLVFTLFAVDINTATVAELTQLKGIGDKKAQAIVEYRTQHKCFKTLKELENVKGIGEAFVKNNEKELKVSPCK